MVATLFSVLAPVFICIGLGWTWARFHRSYDVAMVAALLTNVGAPCLVFHTLANTNVSLEVLGTMVMASVAAIAFCAIAGLALLRVAGMPPRALLPSVMFGNTGNVGLPLCLFAFGNEGLGFAVGIFVTYSVGMFSVGSAVTSGEASLRALFRIPILYAVALAFGFMMTGTDPPSWISRTTQLLGGMTIPMMLITLGVSLARLSVRHLWRSAYVAGLRLILGFCAGLVLSSAVGLEGAARGVVLLQFSMPVAVFNYLFAQRYHAQAEEVAGAVVISTALTFAVLPLLLLFAMGGSL